MRAVESSMEGFLASMQNISSLWPSRALYFTSTHLPVSCASLQIPVGLYASSVCLNAPAGISPCGRGACRLVRCRRSASLYWLERACRHLSLRSRCLSACTLQALCTLPGRSIGEDANPDRTNSTQTPTARSKTTRTPIVRALNVQEGRSFSPPTREPRSRAQRGCAQARSQAPDRGCPHTICVSLHHRNLQSSVRGSRRSDRATQRNLA